MAVHPMTYLSFHFIFLLPPIAALLLTHQEPQRTNGDLHATLALPLICLIAFAYSSPWDNYLVARKIWWYGAERVIGTIGYVPVEEYLFFILQPLLTGLVLYQYLARYDDTMKSTSLKASWTGTVTFTGLTLLGAVLLMDGRPETVYIALILIWAPPILAGMWLYDGETLWALRSPLLAGTVLPTLYLWGLDIVALREQIWTISPKHTLGIEAFGLPLEEASFFLFTNLLVVQGILLLLYPSHEP